MGRACERGRTFISLALLSSRGLGDCGEAFCLFERARGELLQAAASKIRQNVIPCRYLTHDYHPCNITTATLSFPCPPLCFALVWILSTSEPCGFFPLGC